MIGKKMEKALNDQINAEVYSAYLYIAMAASFEGKNLKGFAHWMTVQAQEEVGHAMKIYGYVNSVGGRVVLDAVAKPPKDFGSPLKTFEAAYKHEQYITGRINKLVALAQKESDHTANAFLQWFVTEQVEEEASTSDVVELLKMAKDHPPALFMVDQQLASRTVE